MGVSLAEKLVNFFWKMFFLKLHLQDEGRLYGKSFFFFSLFTVNAFSLSCRTWIGITILTGAQNRRMSSLKIFC